MVLICGSSKGLSLLSCAYKENGKRGLGFFQGKFGFSVLLRRRKYEDSPCFQEVFDSDSLQGHGGELGFSMQL